ncbi:GAF domain-containing sensor histidine kinase [Streptomyces sp. NPDC058471]|uniref:GAF domain-containing sensor histidine kinase n=1 Tax=Streptomyces sp. NPDC058471 TaxID=3346516 RepID=UPI0036469037
MAARTFSWMVLLSSAAILACAGWISTLPHADRLGDSVYFVWVVGGASVEWQLTGAVLIGLRPRNMLGWLFLGAGASSIWQVGLAGYGGYGVAVAQPQWPGAQLAAAVGSGLWFPSMLLTPTIVLALYPNGHLPSRWWRWPVAGSATMMALMVCVEAFDPQAYDDVAPGHAPAVALPPEVLAWLMTGVCLPLLVLSTLAIWVGTIVRLVRARTPERQQLTWFVCGAGPLLVVMFIDVPKPVTAVCVYLIPVVVAVGVLRYRLLGIETVLRRGLVYGSLTLGVIAVYLTATAVVGSALDRRPLPGVVAAALVAVLLAPARDRLQRAADRLVYGARRDPLRAITQLGDEVATAGHVDLLSAALKVVMNALRAPAAMVAAPDGRLVNVQGEMTVTGPVIPLRVGGRDVGTLTLATRGPAESYNDAETRLLTAMALQIAVLVRALELTEALEAERDRVVAATRAERNRLRHDLHDGLGPSLSGMGLGLQALADALTAGDMPTCTALLARVRVEATTAIGEIRRIIDALRPTVLDTRGLADAVREHARTVALTVPVGVTATALPILPPDVETASYRIITEALTNTARHAHAHHAHVTITADTGSLRIVISDDGTGIGAAASGIGLTSMRRRTEALHGDFTVHSTQAGTTVVATLPLENP